MGKAGNRGRVPPGKIIVCSSIADTLFIMVFPNQKLYKSTDFTLCILIKDKQLPDIQLAKMKNSTVNCTAEKQKIISPSKQK